MYLVFTWIFLHTGRTHVYIRRELWLCDPKCIVWHKMCNHKDHTWNSFESCPHGQSGKKFNFYILKQTQNQELVGLKLVKIQIFKFRKIKGSCVWGNGKCISTFWEKATFRQNEEKVVPGNWALISKTLSVQPLELSV